MLGSNTNYSSLILKEINIKKIDFFKKIDIDLYNIKMISLDANDKYEYTTIEIKNCFNILFSSNIIVNNLIILNLTNIYNIDPDGFDAINKLKALRYLYIDTLLFNAKFKINLKTLKLLTMKNFANIDISETSNKNLEVLNIINLKEIEDENYVGMNILKNVDFPKLKALNFSKNKPDNLDLDIDILAELDFAQLKELNLSSNNNLFNVDILEEVNFKDLEILNLSDNDIVSIDFLKRVDFKKLKKLNLSNNSFTSDFYAFYRVDFKDLEILDLSNNMMDLCYIEKKEDFVPYRISILEAILFNKNFKYLYELDISNNGKVIDDLFKEELKKIKSEKGITIIYEF